MGREPHKVVFIFLSSLSNFYYNMFGSDQGFLFCTKSKYINFIQKFKEQNKKLNIIYSFLFMLLLPTILILNSLRGSNVLYWIVSSPQMYVHPEPINVTLSGNIDFVDGIKLNWGHTGLGWALNPMPGVLIRRGNFVQRDTEDRHTGKWPWENGGKNGCDGSTCKEHQRLLGTTRN